MFEQFIRKLLTFILPNVLSFLLIVFCLHFSGGISQLIIIVIAFIVYLTLLHFIYIHILKTKSSKVALFMIAYLFLLPVWQFAVLEPRFAYILHLAFIAQFIIQFVVISEKKQ